MIGQTVTHYKILEKIGSGGMGDVYLAEDTKLDRKVALKVLPPELAESEERRARFEREAKAIAALNHPNIVTVHSVEESDGVHFITMEFVKGKTLTELLPKRGFTISRFLELAIPLSDAVAAAHQEGITHRDLKPANVMVTDDGRIKVLDFGLAKPTGSSGSDPRDSDVPTQHRTQEGRILGTVAYMSPEQAEGKPVDALTDIFSLGIVFYEMLTGERPFYGETPAATLSSILKDTPKSMREHRRELPRDLTKIVSRCLAKETTRRFQSALDVRNELDELCAELASGELDDGVVVHKRPPLMKWLAAATLASVAALVGVLLFFLGPSTNTAPGFTNPTQITSAVGVEDFPTWSPDGGRLAFHSAQSGNGDIWVAQMSGGEPVNLTVGRPEDDREPSWSPDGSQIAFVSGTDILVMQSIGGSPRTVVSHDDASRVRGPRWSPDGAELAAAVEESESQYFVTVVSLRNLETRRVPLSTRCRDMSWSPDGRFFTCVDASDFYEVTRIWLQPSSGGEAITVIDNGTNDFSPTWSNDGRYLFFVSNRGGSFDLWRQKMTEDGRADGEAEALTSGLEIRRAAFSSDAAKLAYTRGRRVANVWRVPSDPRLGPMPSRSRSTRL